MARLTQKQIRALRNILHHTEMKTCSFARPGEYLSDPKFTEEVRAATEVWRESWICGPLRELLRDAGESCPDPY